MHLVIYAYSIVTKAAMFVMSLFIVVVVACALFDITVGLFRRRSNPYPTH